MKFNQKQTGAMLLIIICMVLYTGWYAQSEKKEDFHEGIIRFHVIANSNSKSDQELKLKVRDGVLEAVNQELVRETMQRYDAPEPASETMAQAGGTASQDDKNMSKVALNVDESREYLQGHLDMIQKVSEDIIKENGYNYSTTVELGVRWIPEKTYGDMSFPAGNYEALNITIGQGEGNNWWCVLFPPLCLIDNSDNPNQLQPFSPTFAAIGLTDELMKVRGLNKESISEKETIQLKFKTLELLNK